MPKTEYIKEQIAYLKLWLGLLVLAGIGLAGWLISHWIIATWPILLGAGFGLVAIASGCRVLHGKIRENINQLENL